MSAETIERFDIRLPASTKQMLAKAAEINGSTLTALVIGAAMDKAREILQAHQLFVLNERDWQAFVTALENPPEPNEALCKAWAEYHEAGLVE
ncbi:DUF1778 domain-containing protein [Candidatus Thiothrix sp. Deng01]|uniref:DUF1778 domain-containing protein n=1 Tax=Candidatus Thiothrix phosphatis TaxID=3112415 RepID=A0ABU6CT00_9GAMM|nr:DUF1778 domain-containing protein [Candidatus Thiothrix sp. Deng01]MEB4589960.1 DUF1778 domain-containing protein [Candidatus Thiothrix sp. Deng01]